MKKSLCFQKYLGLMLAFGLFLSACTKDERSAVTKPGPASPSSPGQPAAPATPTNSGNASGPTTAGTGDVGGGNGINGLVLESYRVDVTELEAYKQVIGAKFDRSEDPKTKENNRRFFNHKTWYIAPMKFRPISNEALGLSFTEDQTEQLAVQTKGEVWINKEAFEKMPVKQQADLVLHEIVMSIYLLKFEDSFRLCKMMGFDAYIDCNVFVKNPPFNRAPEPLRKLNEKDYQNIRAATAWLLNEPSPIDQDAEARKFSALEFDQRLFVARGNGPKFNKDLDRELTVPELVRLIQQGYEKDLFQQKCDSSFGAGSTGIPCLFQPQVASVTGIENLELSWKLKVGREIQGSLQFDQNTKANGRFSTDSYGSSVIELIHLENLYVLQKIKPLQPGQKHFTVSALVRKSTPYQALSVELLGLFIAEKVYHGTQESVTSDGTKFNCESESYTLNDAGEPNYILVKSKKFIDTDLGYVIQYGLMDFSCDYYSTPKK